MSRSIRAGEAKATANDAVAQISSNSSSRRSAVSRLESSMPFGIRLGSSTTAAATTGPASGPRPASSQPATGQTPRLISARSRRKLGGATAITPFGSLAGASFDVSDLSRIMPGSCASEPGGATGNSAQFPLFNAVIPDAPLAWRGPNPYHECQCSELGRGAGTRASVYRARFACAPNDTRRGASRMKMLGDARLEQAELLAAAFRPGEMIGGQFRAPLVEPELVAGDLEPAADHPGHRPGALHPRAPLRIVVACRRACRGSA